MPRPQVIAHRGASGHAPEHTVAAKCLAFGMGADFLEQDVVASRDHALVVVHDLYLDEISDVATRFAGRCRADGLHYVIDFDLAELRELHLHERRARDTNLLAYPERFSATLDGLRMLTFSEEIDLIESLNRTAGRSVGIYPEIKDPEWHQLHGFDLTTGVVDVLNARGYGGRKARAYLQSFSRSELERIAREGLAETQRVLLLEPASVQNIDRHPDGWDDVARFAAGVGLPYSSLIEISERGRLAATGLAERIHGAGLEIHPYTLRQETANRDHVDFAALIAFLIDEIEVDALFCDQPDMALQVRDRSQVRPG